MSLLFLASNRSHLSQKTLSIYAREPSLYFSPFKTNLCTYLKECIRFKGNLFIKPKFSLVHYALIWMGLCDQKRSCKSLHRNLPFVLGCQDPLPDFCLSEKPVSSWRACWSQNTAVNRLSKGSIGDSKNHGLTTSNTQALFQSEEDSSDFMKPSKVTRAPSG